jgi:hypothetical protein
VPDDARPSPADRLTGARFQHALVRLIAVDQLASQSLRTRRSRLHRLPFRVHGQIKHSVLAAQPAIRCARAAWQALPVELFEAEEDKPAFDYVLTDTGAFRLLATAIADTTKPHAKGDAQLRLLYDRRYQVFANWRNKRFWNSLVSRIFGLAERFVDELIQQQLSNENRDLAAKSLCDLAKRAKDPGAHSIRIGMVCSSILARTSLRGCQTGPESCSEDLCVILI